MPLSRLRLVIAATAIAGPAFAIPLPPAVYQQTVIETGFFAPFADEGPSSYTFVSENDGSSAVYDNATASVSTDPLPAVSATSATGVFDYTYPDETSTGAITIGSIPPPYLTKLEVEAYSKYQYSFTVQGPASVAVPLVAVFKLAVSATGNLLGPTGGQASASGLLGVTNADGSSSTYDVYVDTLGQSDGSSTIDFPFEVGTVGLIRLEAISDVVSNAVGQSSVTSAYADPYITIDPTWARAHPGYSLSFSAGAGDTSPAAGAPEPATWAMTLVGLGLVGGAFRHRSRRTPRCA